MQEVWPTPFDPYVWKMIAAYSAFELALMRFVPGKEFKATVTASGHVPVYIANGFQSYLITIGTVFALWYSGLFSPADIYDNMGKFLSSMNLFAFLLVAFLMFKGLYIPSTKDHGTNGDIIVDFFWGTELYPRIFGFDIKQFTNCRFGMMFWQVGIICYALKQYELYGYVSSSMIVSVAIQTVYVAKFFLWETGYFCSMDIQHDRAGYYLCWGCLVWVPSMYTMHTYYLTNHPVQLSLPLTIFFLFAGVYCVWVNYDCDR
jgi:7-dehydrocholesterol reductase